MVPRWGVSGNKDSGDESDEDVGSHFVTDFYYRPSFVYCGFFILRKHLILRFNHFASKIIHQRLEITNGKHQIFIIV